MKWFCLAIALATGSASAELSVWEQQRMGMVSPVVGHVRSITLTGTALIFTLEQADKTTSEFRICDPLPTEFYTDEMRTTILRTKIDLLNEARRHKKLLTVGVTGPWQACVETVQITSP